MENRLIPYEAAVRVGIGRMLVLAPHPDDEVFGCGGAILRQIADGGSVCVAVITDGAYRSDSEPATEYGETRRQESRNAAQILDYGLPEFWGLQDRGLEYGESLVQRIVDAIQAFTADYVFAPSVYEMHPDHRFLGMAALEAVRRVGPKTQLAMYEVGVPMLRPNLLLDISDLIERKQQAMECFTSQLKAQAYEQQIRALNRFRSYTLGANVTYAEAYRLIRPEELGNGPSELFEPEYQRQRALGLPVVPADVPLISAIVCAGSQAQLRRSLDSIALQTYPNIEVIVSPIVQCAPAGLGTACGRFPLRTAPFTPGHSFSAACNGAMESAGGQYLILLDAGDALLPDHLEKLAHALLNNSALAAYSGVPLQDLNARTIAMRDEAWSAERLRGSNFLRTCAVLFNRQLLEKGCRLREGFAQVCMWDFWLQIATHTRFQHVPNVRAVEHASIDVPDQAQMKLQDLERELVHARSQADHWKQTADALSTHTTDLQAANAAILGSASWRITAPLRYIARLLQS